MYGGIILFMYRKVFIIILVGCASIFVGVNGFLTQNVPSLFFDLVYAQDYNAAVRFGKLMQAHPDFKNQRQYLTDIYGNVFAQAIVQEAGQKTRLLNSYEAILQKNPNSRDALVQAALIYVGDKNYSKARLYYQKAKAVDPWLHIEALEKL